MIRDYVYIQFMVDLNIYESINYHIFFRKMSLKLPIHNPLNMFYLIFLANYCAFPGNIYRKTNIHVNEIVH